MGSLLNKLQTQNKIAIQLAAISFIAGFITFSLYVITRDEDYAFLGIIILVIAIIFNSILFLMVLGNMLFGSVTFKEGVFTLYVILLNIPITVSYFYINYEIF